MTVYRNDFITEMARSAHQEPAFEQLERRLGGPSFGTVRAVQALLEANGLRLAEVRVPEMLVAREVPRQAKPQAEAAKSPASPAAANPSGAMSARAEPSAIGAADSPPSRTEAGLGSADRPKHGRSKGTKPGRSTLDNIIPGTRTSPRSGGSEYDPLNPNL
jgi:hypothetical protein